MFIVHIWLQNIKYILVYPVYGTKLLYATNPTSLHRKGLTNSFPNKNANMSLAMHDTGRNAFMVWLSISLHVYGAIQRRHNLQTSGHGVYYYTIVYWAWPLFIVCHCMPSIFKYILLLWLTPVSLILLYKAAGNLSMFILMLVKWLYDRARG